MLKLDKYLTFLEGACIVVAREATFLFGALNGLKEAEILPWVMLLSGDLLPRSIVAISFIQIAKRFSRIESIKCTNVL